MKLLIRAIARFLLVLGIQSLFVYVLLITAFDRNFSNQNINDAVFVVGAIVFSIGLITVSNAGKVFDGFRFAFKQLFSRHNYTHLAFYDYKRQLEEKEAKVTGVYTLLGGLTFIAVSSIIGFMYFT